VKEPKKEGEEQQVKKEVKTKFRNTALKYEESVLNQCSKEQINKYLEVETQMKLNDKTVVETLEKKNDLEAFIYNWRGALVGQYRDFVQQDTVQAFLQQLQLDEAWLYDEGANAKKNEYLQRLQKLQKFTDPVKNRFDQFNLQQELLGQLDAGMQAYYQKATANVISLFKLELYDHIKNEEK